MTCVKAPRLHVCDRKFLLNLTPMEHTLLKFCLGCNLMSCDSVAVPSLPTSARFIISFSRELCQFALVCNMMHPIHTCEKSLFLHGPSIIITWMMQFINFCKIL